MCLIQLMVEIDPNSPFIASTQGATSPSIGGRNRGALKIIPIPRFIEGKEEIEGESNKRDAMIGFAMRQKLPQDARTALVAKLWHRKSIIFASL